MNATLGVDAGVKVKRTQGAVVLIGELSGRTGASTRSLRYYEDQGLLTPTRDGNGYRRYGPDAELRVRQIQSLLDAGFGSRSIAAVLPCLRGTRPHLDLCPEVAAEMRRIVEQTEAEMRALERRRRAVDHLLGGATPVTIARAG